jgi:hypothetical protein
MIQSKLIVEGQADTLFFEAQFVVGALALKFVVDESSPLVGRFVVGESSP